MSSFTIAFLLLFQNLFALDQTPEFPLPTPPPASQQKQTSSKALAANVIFKSTDRGQIWQDISEGLPENLQEEAIQRGDFLVKDSELYIRAGNGIYRSKSNSTAPYWTRETFPNRSGSLAPGKSRVFAYNYGGQILQKVNGACAWLPTFTNLQQTQLRTVFETVGGTIFIGSDQGLFKSTNQGDHWKQVHTGGWVMKLVESDGVLLATSQDGIIRSTDGGENWDLVISEGGVGIAVERIKDGFAAITYNTESGTRRLRTSYDDGKTWHPIDYDLPPSQLVASIIQVGEDLFCGHPAGIFRSSDQGKTWQLVLPTLEERIFDLSVSGNVIYAIAREAGC